MRAEDHALVLPVAAVSHIMAEVVGYGSSLLETGGFFLASRATPATITVVAMAGEVGIERGWGFFKVTGSAIDEIFRWAEEREMYMPAQFHSHRYGAGLSLLDKRHGFNVPDFISCVVPHFDAPPSDPTAWGWWRFDGAVWVGTSPASLGDGHSGVVVFDEEGVRARD